MIKAFKVAATAAFLALVLGAWVYGHSSSFKAGCVVQKAGIARMGFPKGLVCDLMFDIKAR